MKTLNFTSYISATDFIQKKLLSVKENPDVEHVLIVPEVYTLEYERLIYGKSRGSFSVQVKSFSRLFSNYCDDSEVITKSGAVLLIKKIAYEIADKLTCFKNSYSRSGFALKMYETISRLSEQEVNPDDMRAESMKKNKINDVKLLYKEYLDRTKDKYVDSVGKKRKLVDYFSALESKENKYYYVLNFDVLTSSTMRLIKAIDGKSNGVTVLSVNPVPKTTNAKSLAVYKARDMIDQLKTVARSISRDLYNGVSPDDIIIAGENLEYDTIKRILSDFDVPFCMSKKESISTHPLCAYLLCAIQCVRKGMKRDDVIALAKNPSVSATKQERDAFCRYVSENLVDYKGFLTPFCRDSVYREKAERVRERISNIFTNCGIMRSSLSVFEFVKISKTILQSAYLPMTVVGLEFDKVKDLLIKSLDFMLNVYSDCVMSGDFLVDSLRDLLVSTEFSVVQKASSVVKVGTLNDFRGQRYKKIYLLSFNDGIMPKIEEDVALLTDSDIVEMESFGLNFEGRISVLNERYRDELWQLLQNESDVFTSYVCDQNGKKSYDLQILQSQFAQVNDVSKYTYLSALNTCLDEQRFAELVATKANGKELIGVSLDKKLRASLIKAIGIKDENYCFQKGIKEGEFSLSTTSVSALQSYYSCPFSYFCKYVLRIEKNEDGKVTPIDVGNIMHATLSEFLLLEEKEPIKENVLKIVNAHLEQNPRATIEANKAVVERLKIEAEKVCALAYAQICKGKYRVKSCEIPFGKSENELKTVTFNGKNGDIKLVGAIDRIDEWENRARVIDYKTGSGGKFSFSDVYYGVKLQLPLYMSVAINNGYKAGGFFYFPFASSWSEEESACKLSGVYEDSDENVLAMETGSLSNGATIFDMPISKRTNKPNRKSGLDETSIKNVCDYAIRMAQNAINAIENGEFSPKPIKTAKSNVCAFCDFVGICKRDSDLPARSKSVNDTIAKKYFTKEN